LYKVEIEAVIKTLFEEKSLQVVDFVSWAIFRKSEYKDKSYYDVIKSKIVGKNPLFPQKCKTPYAFRTTIRKPTHEALLAIISIIINIVSITRIALSKNSGSRKLGISNQVLKELIKIANYDFFKN
jgi:hypothetical protein